MYDFGKTNNDIKLQTAARDSYRFKLMATLTDVAEKTATAYMEVSRYQALCDAAQRNIHSLENVYNMAALRANAGLNSSSDELQAQTRIAGMRSTLEQYQAQMASAKAQLAVLTGVQPEAIAAPPAELAEQPVSLKNIDYQSIPLVLAAENLRQSAQYGVEKRKRNTGQRSVFRGKTRYQTSDRSYWDDQLQLNVNAPLYQGGAVSASATGRRATKNLCLAGRTGKTGCAATSVCGICQLDRRTGSRRSRFSTIRKCAQNARCVPK